MISFAIVGLINLQRLPVEDLAILILALSMNIAVVLEDGNVGLPWSAPPLPLNHMNKLLQIMIPQPKCAMIIVLP